MVDVQDGDYDALEAFDDASFLDAMRRELLFGSTAPDDMSLRELTASGWRAYDVDHCADYYDGPWGPTRSALAFCFITAVAIFVFLTQKVADPYCRGVQSVSIAVDTTASVKYCSISKPKIQAEIAAELHHLKRTRSSTWWDS
ncbi:Hypothetical protein PHPALM_621 [Phytophthora palmivora]|uniref:Uncharacterized protein n=1 Tax=Phytophthora palmivora TaxID=4796 RepID=A0A2P4YUD8_9STRA|nr:Hypothetical protein PHPALM_621 [Phytophthora palmivora]